LNGERHTEVTNGQIHALAYSSFSLLAAGIAGIDLISYRLAAFIAIPNNWSYSDRLVRLFIRNYHAACKDIARTGAMLRCRISDRFF
jgi:hypothetical protein